MNQNSLNTQARETWASFAPMAIFTTPVAAHLVKFAQVAAGERLLDIGTGTGVVAITAARVGAQVTALDLTPQLLDEARSNAKIARLEDIVWTDGDAERLPYDDGSFDVVLSQFGHMFAPHPDLVIAEMRRVLKPEGRIAFATWPLEALVGQMFALIGRHGPLLPPGFSPPGKWGDEAFIAARLDSRFVQPSFERGIMQFPALSLEHYRRFIEHSIGPMQKLVAGLSGDAEKLAALRAAFDTMVAPWYAENLVRQDYLLTRAQAQ